MSQEKVTNNGNNVNMNGNGNAYGNIKVSSANNNQMSSQQSYSY